MPEHSSFYHALFLQLLLNGIAKTLPSGAWPLTAEKHYANRPGKAGPNGRGIVSLP